MIIDPRKSYNYFDSNFELKKSTNGWWVMDCPRCGNDNKKGGVHFHYGIYKCWVCENPTNIVKFVSELEACSYFQALDILNNRKASNISLDYSSLGQAVKIENDRYIDMPKGFHTLMEGDGILATRAREYLTGRGYDIEELDFEGFGYCNEQCTQKELDEGKEDLFGYILIPFKMEGRLIYYIGRDYIGNFLRYKNPSKSKFGIGKGDLLFNGDALNIYEECFLLEGWADAKTLAPSAMSSQGWSLSTSQKSLIQKSKVCKRLTLVPDAGADNSGELFYTKALKLACDFVEDREVRVLNLNGLGEGKDVNELGADIVLELADNTPWMDYGDLVSKIIEQ